MKKRAAALFVLALLVRLAYVAAAPSRSMDVDDSFQWNNTALHFLQGSGFLSGTGDLDQRRPPVYPLFLAANYFFFGENNYAAAKTAQAVAGALTVVAVFFIGLLLFGDKAALWSGLACALHPPFIVYCGILQSETLFALTLMLFILAWILSARGRGWLTFAVAGAMLGILNLSRGTTQLFHYFILALPLAVKEERKNLTRYLLLIAVAFALVAPWSYRNWKIYGVYKPIHSGGELMWFGTQPISVQKQYGSAPEYLALPKTYNNLIEEEKYYKNEARKNILRDPAGYALLTVQKFFYFWFKPIGHEILSKKSALLGHVFLLYQALLIVLFVRGIIVTKSSWRDCLPLYLLLGYFAFLHTLLMPMPRFRLPVEFLILLFAATGAAGSAGRPEESKPRSL